MDVKINALMLRAVDYKDCDRMVTLYSLERGKIGAAMRGVKKAGAKLVFAAQPFCFAEYIINESGDKRNVIGATEIESFYDIRLDIRKYYAACAISQYLLKCSGDEEPDEKLFLATVNALKKLNYESYNPKGVVVNFLIIAVADAGYALRTERCIYCGKKIETRAFFNFDKGAAVCENCAKSEVEIMPLTLDTLTASISGSNDLTDEGLNRALRFLQYYIALKTGEELSSILELAKI